MSSPPQFKFTIVASFQDPLTRQIAESVRIDRGGEAILNSKSEYSSCHVPRLRTKEVSATVQEEEVEIALMVQEDGHHVDELEELEASARRLDSKRKGEETTGRKVKKRKYPKLEGWGEQEGDSIQREGLNDWLIDTDRMEEVVIDRLEEPVTTDRIDKETLIKLQKPSKVQDRRLTISKGVRKKSLYLTPEGN